MKEEKSIKRFHRPLTIITVLIILAALILWSVYMMSKPYDRTRTTYADFVVEEGEGLSEIAVNLDEQKFIERYLAKAEKQQSYWIGLTTGKDRAFTAWVTKEAISYTKWMDGNPDRKVPDTQGTSETLLRFMEVADSLEYGIQGISDPEDAHLAGLKNILRQMTDIFAAYGIERYGCVGETFDPKIHNAVYHITDIDLPEQSIHQVVQSGYRSGERILRFASLSP